jgi:hydroxypyruvate reductase
MAEITPDREQHFTHMRATAREIFSSALKNASIESAFARHLHCERGVLRICDDLYDLNSYDRVFVVSIGKAAHSMVAALEAQVGNRLEGIVASSVEPATQVRGFRYFRGGHPTPTAESIRAAEAILKSLKALNASSLVIFMLSGGGSSIVEKPVATLPGLASPGVMPGVPLPAFDSDDEISLADLVATYRALVHSGAPIAAINTVRKHLSAVKGGRLAQAAYPAQQVSILVSDVPDATPDALASGVSMPDSTSVYDCERIAAEYHLLRQFPRSVAELFRRHALEETPKSDDPAFVRARWWVVLSNEIALGAAAAAARNAGFTVEIDNSCDDWDYEKAADYLLGRLRGLRGRAPRVCLLSGGEVTVTVVNGGVGGRNQQFALACAEKILGEDITVLSAGTDGIDGNSPAAGAIVDGSTVSRAATLASTQADSQSDVDLQNDVNLPKETHSPSPGIHAARNALAAFNAHPLMQSLGDAIVTGPTGNNLRDLRILLAY